jgi:hypothetical protein
VLVGSPQSASIFGPDPLSLDGRTGLRYWVHHPYPLTGHPGADERLAGYPVAVFLPSGRPAGETPVLVGLQGMAAPYSWNSFLVPTLLDMGIACVLFDAPLAGERSLARKANGSIFTELLPLARLGVTLDVAVVGRLLDVVARDLGTVLHLVLERHGLDGGRVALFGISLGALLTSFAFMRDGTGARLLGAIGHADLPCFARSYLPRFTPLLVSPPVRVLGKLAALWLGPGVRGGLGFLTVLRELASRRSPTSANPMTFADRVAGDRRVRFLVGQEDPLVNPGDAVVCVRRFPGGECYVVPGLAHGRSRFGPPFVEHVRTFIGTQLGDWKW